jgi:tetratricopeptide (TPR) repeat protein
MVSLIDDITGPSRPAKIPIKQGLNRHEAEIERIARKPTESLHAYDYFLRGRAVAHTSGATEIGTEALRLFYKAVELDPNFAAAYGMIAWAYVNRKVQGLLRDEEKPEAERVAQRAIKLGKNDADALSYGAFALGYVIGRLDEAIDYIEQALTINPNLAIAWAFSAWLRTWQGDVERAIDHGSRGMRLNPRDPFINIARAATACALLFAGRDEEAWSWAEKAARDRPNATNLRMVAIAASYTGRQLEAKRAIAVDPALRVSHIRHLLPIRRPEHLAKYEEGLRKAGLPE